MFINIPKTAGKGNKKTASRDKAVCDQQRHKLGILMNSGEYVYRLYFDLSSGIFRCFVSIVLLIFHKIIDGKSIN